MSLSATIYQVMIGSPSDVQPEREAVAETLLAWNQRYGLTYRVFFQPLRYEEDTVPLVMGIDGQAVINRQLCQRSDMLIAIFWSKLGSPTPRYQSGTEEEIEEHVKENKFVFPYFCERPIPQGKINDDWQALCQFKERMKDKGLYRSFQSEDDLKQLLERDLNNFVDLYAPLEKNALEGDRDSLRMEMKKNDDVLQSQIDLLAEANIMHSLFRAGALQKGRDKKITQ